MRLCRLLLPALLLLQLVCAEKEGVEEVVGDFLYGSDDPESVFPIVDYVSSRDSVSSADEENFSHPDFLYSTSSGYRIVEFYAPWCTHCREFKNHFISFARTITKLVEKQGHKVDFYAISCTAHRAICRDFGVSAYPRIRVYKAGSINATIFHASDVHPFVVMDALGFPIDPGVEYGEEMVPTQPSLAQKKVRTRGQETDTKTTMPRIRDKKALYRDISNSFDFAMKNSIYTFKGEMNDETKEVFTGWIDLLYCAIPPSLQVHKAVESVRDNLDTVVLSETDLIRAVDKYPPEEKGWSFACTHGDHFAGYTCGLWELFHLVTIGVVEWNSFAGDDDYSKWPLSDASDLIRNYVENFFGCEVCRLNFIAMYDSCSHDRCVRLPSSTNGTTHIEWRQLPLWLWEVHNSVNVRLMKERAEKANKEVTHQDEIDAMFPSRSQCPHCWRADESWDEEMVYKFLRLEYWPHDATSEAYRRDLLARDVLDDNNYESWALSLWFLPVIIGTFFAVWAYSEKYKRDKTGRHKKVDY